MKKEVREYYAAMKQAYPTKIRQLVPRYDEMVELIVDLLRLSDPRTVLDIGAGVGNVSSAVLQAFPGARVTVLEPSHEMFTEAARTLSDFSGRAELVNQDVLDFVPERGFDAIFSNLVLHNIPLGEKRRLLGDLIGWLEPGGSFIWGDLIRYSDQRLQAHYIDYRKRFAAESGCPSEVVEKDSRKEAELDHPLTAEQTLDEARTAGFGQVSLAWAHDMFAIFHLTKS